MGGMWGTACGNDDERILVLTPSPGLFYCFDAKVGGDCLALVQHITGLDVQDAAAYLVPQQREEPTPTRRQEKPKEKSAPIFDAEAFAEKLEYADDTARALLIGTYKNRLYIGSRYESDSIAGFTDFANGEVVHPKQWLSDVPSNVVKLRA